MSDSQAFVQIIRTIMADSKDDRERWATLNFNTHQHLANKLDILYDAFKSLRLEEKIDRIEQKINNS